ncbi:hypothetical protein Pint_26213 [Pistacia integerrima]|uniref:Uncharacterized protein n=1 Tax=Pistacia integerrima TaxID=434235 RepID=A0ACC0YFD3_9ROSI|nr:hypothetical protein Pint_26213 [Pistacia integerrima]
MLKGHASWPMEGAILAVNLVIERVYGKIYVDKETGRKTDGLVTYLKEPSVALAIHFGWSSFSSRWKDPYAITQAKFEQKGDNFVSKQVDNRKKKNLKFEEKMFGWVALMMQRFARI